MVGKMPTVFAGPRLLTGQWLRSHMKCSIAAFLSLRRRAGLRPASFMCVEYFVLMDCKVSPSRRPHHWNAGLGDMEERVPDGAGTRKADKLASAIPKRAKVANVSLDPQTARTRSHVSLDATDLSSLRLCPSRSTRKLGDDP